MMVAVYGLWMRIQILAVDLCWGYSFKSDFTDMF